MNVKSVDLEDLFSQIGGSVGILLGYSILQIPSLISMINSIIVVIYAHFTGTKKEVDVGKNVAKNVIPLGKIEFSNDDQGLMLVNQSISEVYIYSSDISTNIIIFSMNMLYCLK